MNKLERLKVKLEAIEDEPTPKQVLSLVADLIELLEEKQKIGFKNGWEA
jgi:hypothetical protein